MALQGFVESEYLAAKLAQLQSNYTEWAGKDADFLKTVLANLGMTPEQHYQDFGWAEGLAPNNLFNAAEYKLAKAQALFDAGAFFTLQEAKDAFAAAWTDDPYLHYIQFGSAEGVNPSNSFDESSYLASKLAALQADAATSADWAGKTVDDVRAAFTAAGLSALGHYQLIGKGEGIAVTAVPAEEQVNPGTDPGDVGETYVLTINQDTITGTDKADTFSAPASQGGGTQTLINTLQNVDILDGEGGTDTLNVTMIANAAPSMSNIEVVNARFSAVSILDLANTSGITDLNVANSTTVGRFNNVGAIDKFSVANQTQDVIFDSSTAAALNVGLTSFGKAGTNDVLNLGATAAAKATTLNLTAENAYVDVDSAKADAFSTVTVEATGANNVNFVDSGATIKSMTVKGTGSVDFKTLATAFTGAMTTFDASENSGGVKAEITSTKAAAVTGGSGNDVFDMDGTFVVKTTVATGAGDDQVFVGSKIANFDSLDGGDGTDIINITDGAGFTKANVAKISNFETLDVSGGKGTFDLGLKSFDVVQIDEAISGAPTGALIINNAPAGFELDVASNAKTNANFTLAPPITVALKDATGTSDSVTIDVSINDGNNDATADGNVILGAGKATTTIAGVETITVNSNVVTPDTGVGAGNYTTTFNNLNVNDVTTLDINGDSSVVFTALTNGGNTLTKIDASGSTGAVTINAAGIASQVAYTGSAGVDAYTATDGGSIYGGSGNDAITLTGANGESDTIVYKSAGDVSFTNNTDATKIDAAVVETVAGFETAVSDVAGAGGPDVLDFSNFSFTGYAAAGMVNKGALANALGGGAFAWSTTDFFADAGGDRGIAFGTNGGNTLVFVDVNSDGDWNAGDDLAIQLTGVVDFSFADVAV